MPHLPKAIVHGISLIFAGSNSPSNACPTLVYAPGMDIAVTIQELSFALTGSRFVSDHVLSRVGDHVCLCRWLGWG